MGEYARKLAHIARWHAMGLYGQTGTGRGQRIQPCPGGLGGDDALLNASRDQGDQRGPVQGAAAVERPKRCLLGLRGGALRGVVGIKS